jgi:hypothetical protein
LNEASGSSCPRCGLRAPTGALSACPRCLLSDLDQPEPLPEDPQGLELIEEIGRGGMGRVFRARHRKLDREVAVKLLPSELSTQPSFRARFEREARTLGRLSHPNIVMVHDFGALSDGSGYLVMEHVAGGTLRARLPLPFEAALEVARQLCSALAYAHQRGVVHRDIKPENVLFDGEGRARLADFGIARLLADDNATLTSPLVVLGTPRYMAPEARAGSNADPRVDVFALGVLFEEMLAEGVKTPERAAFRAIAKRACATDPLERYASAAELKRALDELRLTPAAPSSELPAEEQSLLRAVALTLAGATAVSLFALLRSVTPRVLEANETLPLIMFDAQRLADGRLATRARFETWPTLWATGAWIVAFVAYGLLRGHWRRAGLDTPTPEQPLRAVRPVLRIGVLLNALYVPHLLLEAWGLRSWISYLPILGGILELVMVYLVWVAVLESLRTSRSLRREPLLWVGAVLSLIPPVISSLRLIAGGQLWAS